jgi:hypothetical protein
MGLREMAEGVGQHEVDTEESPVVTGADVARARATAKARTAGPIEMDPDIPESRDVAVHAAWSRVMGEVLYIAKADRTTSGSTYNYRGVDRVVDEVAPMLRKHGIIVMPVKVRAEYAVILTTKGASMNYCRATVSFAIIGPRGDALSAPHPETGIVGALLGEAIGEGFDSGDKSSMKAQSVAYREFLIKALAIPVNRPQANPEHGEQHEIAGPARRSPAQYASEILSEETSINKLSQIQQELYGDKATAVTEVELADGEKIRLVDLVLRVGKQRKAAQA